MKRGVHLYAYGDQLYLLPDGGTPGLFLLGNMLCGVGDNKMVYYGWGPKYDVLCSRFDAVQFAQGCVPVS